MDTFSEFAKYYDAIYYDESRYEAESREVHSLIDSHIQTTNDQLLDVACGTGTHIDFFQNRYRVSGLDLSSEMLAIAAERHPDVDFYNEDLADFTLGRTFGVILCLYGSIGFTQSTEKLERALRTFGNHLDPGGILVLTPWSNTEEFEELIFSDTKTWNGIHLSRMEAVTRTATNTVNVSYHYLIGEDRSIRHYSGHHPPIRLFSPQQYETAITSSGLQIIELHRSEEIQMGMAYLCGKPTH